MNKDIRARALRERGASNSVAALMISTLTQIFAPGRSMKTRGRVLSNLQKLFLSVHPAVIKMAGMFMTQPGLGSPVVSLGALITQ